MRLASGEEIAARKLVLMCDGRSSLVRGTAAARRLGAPIDVFWFARAQGLSGGLHCAACIRGSRMIVLIDRGDYWQCAYVIAKGGAEAIKARGIAALRDNVRAVAPDLPALEAALPDLDEVQLLSVSLDRLTAGRGPACWRLAMPHMRCGRSAGSASIWRFRMRSLPPIFSPRRCSRG